MESPYHPGPMDKEWEAWRDVVKLWPGDMNESKWNPLVRAIERWGEILVELRMTQTSEIVNDAKNDAEKGYARALAK